MQLLPKRFYHHLNFVRQTQSEPNLRAFSPGVIQNPSWKEVCFQFFVVRSMDNVVLSELSNKASANPPKNARKAKFGFRKPHSTKKPSQTFLSASFPNLTPMSASCQIVGIMPETGSLGQGVLFGIMPNLEKNSKILLEKPKNRGKSQMQKFI